MRMTNFEKKFLALGIKSFPNNTMVDYNIKNIILCVESTMLIDSVTLNQFSL